MSRFVGVALLVVLVVLAGCAGLSGDDSADLSAADDGDATSGVADEAAADDDDGVTVEIHEADDDGEEADDGLEYDPAVMSPLIEEPTAVTVSVYRHNETYPLPDGQLEVTDEGGEVVVTRDVSTGVSFTIEELEPGQNYTLGVTNFTGHTQFPPTTKQVDPGQTDEADFFAAFEMPGADRYEFQWRSVEHQFLNGTEIVDAEELEERNRQVFFEATYDNGNFMMSGGHYAQFVDPDINVPKFGAVNHEYYLRDFNKDWREADKDYSIDPNYSPEMLPVNKGLEALQSLTDDLEQDEFDRLDDIQAVWAYNETVELNDTRVPEPLRFEPMPEENENRTVHVYDVNIWGYTEVAEINFSYHRTGNAQVYVDVETGYVLRWTANERVSPGTGSIDYARGMNPSVHVIDFYNHDTEEAEIDPEEYEPFN